VCASLFPPGRRDREKESIRVHYLSVAIAFPSESQREGENAASSEIKLSSLFISIYLL